MSGAARLLERARASGYVAGWQVVRRLPERRSRALFDRIADRVFAANGKSVQRLRSNLSRAGVSDADDLRTAVRSYLRYWCESFRLPSWPLDDLVARTDPIDAQVIQQAIAAGRGVVVALPHMANWDWAGAWAGREVSQVMSVAERLKPERLFDEFVAYRESIGIHVVPLTGGTDPLPELAKWVTGGGLVCLLADRDLSRSSVTVELLGEPAKVPPGPAVLAKRTGAPLIPVTLWYDGPRMSLRFHQPIPHGEVDVMMQGVADAFTESIRAHPLDWHMMQRVFEADL
ncbi:MAG: lipid biosynthesis acyltransferase [Arthrobacter sp.]|nr:lipid biosynthesis acyltransferase [Arthrobacter sp.]MCW2782669.1 lipid biosynthesis acyltransferase [Marmoricola sp.]